MEMVQPLTPEADQPETQAPIVRFGPEALLQRAHEADMPRRPGCVMPSLLFLP